MLEHLFSGNGLDVVGHDVICKECSSVDTFVDRSDAEQFESEHEHQVFIVPVLRAINCNRTYNVIKEKS